MALLIGILLFTFILGTVIGSFLNVVALRGLTGESIVFPSSKCPKCGNKIKPWHNIPILSYFLLGGKCAYCKEKISIQYPIVEFLTGLLLVGCLLKYSLTLTALFVFIACATLFVMSITDIREKVICAWHAWFMIIMGLIYNVILSHSHIQAQLETTGQFLFNAHNFLNLPITSSVLGLIAGVIIMEILAAAGYLIVGKRAFGTGDTFIAAGIGAFFGWRTLLITLALSIAVQIVIVMPSFFRKLKARNDNLTIASIVVFLLAAAGFSAANYYGYIEDFIICLIASLILLVIGVYACVRIIKGIKEEGDVSILPFGPAMTIAALIVLFVLA